MDQESTTADQTSISATSTHEYYWLAIEDGAFTGTGQGIWLKCICGWSEVLGDPVSTDMVYIKMNEHMESL